MTHRTRPARPLALAAAGLVLALAAAGCGGGGGDAGEAAEAPPGGWQTFSGGPPGGMAVVIPPEGREPDELNPLTYDSNPAYQVVHLLFRSLARRDSTLSGYQPDLARSWEVDPEAGTVTLHLRPDVEWHDGTPVRAKDVVFTIERQKMPETASPRVSDVEAVKSVEALDSLTVRATLDPLAPATVNALLEVVPVPEHLLGDVAPDRMGFAGFGRNPVGNGLFRFGEWQAGQQLTLLANPDAPEGRPALDRLVMRFIPDVNAAMTALLSAQADVFKIPSDQRDRVETSDQVELYPAPRVRPAWIAWNVDRAPVNDERVRRALLMAIDRESLVKGLFAGSGEAALSPIPPTLREHSPDVTPIPHDPAQAMALLEQAGWRDTDGDGIRDKGGRPLRIEVDYNASDPTRQDVLVAMQSALRRVGVDLAPTPYESTTWVNRLRQREFTGSFWGWGWGPGVMAPNANMIFHSRSIPPGGPNFAGMRNPRADVLIDSLLVEADTTVSRRMWRELEQILIDEAVYAPIYLDPEFYGVHQRIANVKMRGIEWWEDVPYWYVPQESRLPRDRTR